MQALLEGIRKGRFVVFGRAGMDMFADPPGTKAEHAETFRADLGGSSANICAGLSKLGMQSALVTSVSAKLAPGVTRCSGRLNIWRNGRLQTASRRSSSLHTHAGHAYPAPRSVHYNKRYVSYM